MMSDERMANPKGRVAGVVMLVIGSALLLVVFFLAARTFAGLSAPAHGSSASGLESASALLARIGARTAMLLVMAYASSLVASKGIELFAASSGRPPS
jgi:hypothetical protein